MAFNFYFINFCQIAVLQSSCDFTDTSVGHVACFLQGRNAASSRLVPTSLLLPQSSTSLVLAMMKLYKQHTKELSRIEAWSHSLHSGRVHLHQLFRWFIKGKKARCKLNQPEGAAWLQALIHGIWPEAQPVLGRGARGAMEEEGATWEMDEVIKWW